MADRRGECNLYVKLLRGLPLNDEELNLLGNIIREELKFLIRNNILPTPKNYERWFLVLCYAMEKNKNLSDHELIDMYQSMYKNESLSEVSLDVEKTIEVLNRLVKDIQKAVEESNDFAYRKEKELIEIGERLTDEELTSILLELLLHVKDLKAQNEKFLRRIEEQQKVIEELKERMELAESEANIDYLTQTFNRRSFERALQEAFKDFKEKGAVFSLVIIDLDNFKYINDKYGHSMGDIVLKRVAHGLRVNLRAKDILARWGGDEFAILMPGTKEEQAKTVAERLKRGIESIEVVIHDEKVGLSFSYGVVEVSDNFSSTDDMIKEADRRMYQQKNNKPL
jgi:diguanylate cyclase